jgi:hypothetical protein
MLTKDFLLMLASYMRKAIAAAMAFRMDVIGVDSSGGQINR